MILVTGITGHSGRYLLKALIDNEYKDCIRCVVRKTSDISMLINSGLNIERVIGDLDDYEFINRIMVNIDTVVQIYNIHYSLDIIQNAIRNNVKNIILVHTTGIYSKFKSVSSEYINIEKKVFKLMNSGNCKTNIIILRPTMIYGDLCDHNISKFIKMVDKYRIIPVINHGDNLIQPVNARDLGKIIYHVLTSLQELENRVYNISGDRPIKLIDVLKLISSELNKKTIFISVPLRAGVYAAKFLKVITFGKTNFVEKIQRMSEDRSCSHECATKDLGYIPLPFEAGIKLEIQEYLDKCRFAH